MIATMSATMIVRTISAMDKAPVLSENDDF